MKDIILLGISVYLVFMLSVTYLINMEYYGNGKRLLSYIIFAALALWIIWSLLEPDLFMIGIIGGAANLILIIVLNRKMKILYQMVYLDSLTGTHNRRYLDEYWNKLPQRGENPEACIMIDIDRFKDVNDTYGHYIGDEVLKSTAQLLQECIGLSKFKGFVARHGGDEFYVVLHTNDRAGLEQTVHEIEDAIKRHNFDADTARRISCSMGYDVYNPLRWEDFKMFEVHIDTLMYENKRRKRAVEKV